VVELVDTSDLKSDEH